MRRTPSQRTKTRARALFGVAGLCIAVAACGTYGARPNVSPGAADRGAAQFTLDTPIDQICEDPRGRAVLDGNLPNLRKNPNYFLFQGMSLRQVASMSGGKITRDNLESLQRDLAAISGPAAGAR